jgi:hypothetical protein
MCRSHRFEQKTYDLGVGVDFTNIGETLEMLDEPDFARFTSVTWINPLAPE